MTAMYKGSVEVETYNELSHNGIDRGPFHLRTKNCTAVGLKEIILQNCEEFFLLMEYQQFCQIRTNGHMGVINLTITIDGREYTVQKSDPESVIRTLLNKLWSERAVVELWNTLMHTLSVMESNGWTIRVGEKRLKLWNPNGVSCDELEIGGTYGSELRALGSPEPVQSMTSYNHGLDKLNTSETTEDASVPDEHIIDIDQDIDDITVDVDFESEMYRLDTDEEFEHTVATVEGYHADESERVVTLYLECPDQSIGELEYDWPESAEGDSSFEEMLSVAYDTNQNNGGEISLSTVELLQNAVIPVLEHNETWCVDRKTTIDRPDTSRSNTTEIDVGALNGAELLIQMPILCMDGLLELARAKMTGSEPKTIVASSATLPNLISLLTDVAIVLCAMGVLTAMGV